MIVETENLMTANRYCNKHRIEYRILYELCRKGIMEYVIIDKKRFIDTTKYPKPIFE